MPKEYSCVKKTKQTFENSLAELAEGRPLNKITVKMLCEHAQLSRNAFYFHYKDINDLVEDMEDSIVNEAVGNFDTYTEIGFPKNVHAIIASLVDLIESRPQVCKMLFENSDSFTTRLNEAFCDFNYKYFSDYHGDEKRIVYNFFYMFISNGFYGLVKYWLDNMDKMNKNELIGLCYIFVKRVLLLDKPDINAKDIST